MGRSATFFSAVVSILAVVFVAANADGNTTTAAPEVETTTAVSPTLPPTVPPTVPPTEAPTTTAKPTAAPTKAPHIPTTTKTPVPPPLPQTTTKPAAVVTTKNPSGTTTKAPNAKDNSGLGAGWIILIVVLSLLVVGGVAYGILVWRRNKRGVARHSLSFFETDDTSNGREYSLI